jgi:hypothetical protein
LKNEENIVAKAKEEASAIIAQARKYMNRIMK